MPLEINSSGDAYRTPKAAKSVGWANLAPGASWWLARSIGFYHTQLVQDSVHTIPSAFSADAEIKESCGTCWNICCHLGGITISTGHSYNPTSQAAPKDVVHQGESR